MKKPDFSKQKFRASSIAKLMVNSRKKSDPLSQTTKSYLQELWIKEVFGREKDIATNAMEKGTIVESDSLELVQNVHGVTYFKNNTSLENEWVTGTPDVIDKDNDLIIDIKSPWDIWTFTRVDQKAARKNYYYQVMTYMWLTDTHKAKLVYALVNTPEHIMQDELYKLSFKKSVEELEELKKNYIYDDIPEEMRLREYVFERDEFVIDEIKRRIQDCRNYLSEFSYE